MKSKILICLIILGVLFIFSGVSANQTEMSSDNSLCDDEVAYTPEYQPYTELN